LKRILLADDHVLLRKGLANLLKAELGSVTIGEAANSAEVVDFINNKEWDLVVLDIELCGRDGLDILGGIHSSHPRLPVLMLSRHPVADLAVRAIKLGAAGYVCKQGAADEVVGAVKAALAGKRHIGAQLAEKLADSLCRGHSKPHEALSAREFQIMRMIAIGKNLKQIGSELHLSAKTIGTYRKRIFQKVGIKNDIELTRYVLLNKLAD
jgi:DNA-binding NarL/FixJ family response regulator